MKRKVRNMFLSMTFFAIGIIFLSNRAGMTGAVTLSTPSAPPLSHFFGIVLIFLALGIFVVGTQDF